MESKGIFSEQADVEYDVRGLYAQGKRSCFQKDFGEIHLKPTEPERTGKTPLLLKGPEG